MFNYYNEYIYNLVLKKKFLKKVIDNKQNCFMCICGSDWIGNLTDKQFLVFIWELIVIFFFYLRD